MPALRDLLSALLGPADVERLVDAQVRQAAALERLVQLGEIALGVDASTVQAAAAAAAVPPGSIDVAEYKPAELRALEDLITGLATNLGRIPTDEEVDAEIQRQQSVDEAAQLEADHFAARGGFHG